MLLINKHPAFPATAEYNLKFVATYLTENVIAIRLA
jgi:hypothetical protein